MAATETLIPGPEHGGGLSSGARPPGRTADRIFRWVAMAAGLTVFVVLALIVVSTTNEAWSWFSSEGLGAVTNDEWSPSTGRFGAFGLLYGTVVVATTALVLAVPVSIGIALFVTEVAPRRLRRPIVFLIDLLAAVPSVVFGLWALHELARGDTGTAPISGFFNRVSDLVSGVPVLRDVFFHEGGAGLSYATGGIVVAIMITPIMTSIVREVYATCPASQKEAALALGATRWEMIRGAVFPHGRSGMVAAVMIGFGRAVGETIAVALIVGSSQQASEAIFGPGDTMASVIANEFGEAFGTWRSALIGLGVVLLALTIVLGILARGLLARANRRLGHA